jgi:hypothetical protein
MLKNKNSDDLVRHAADNKTWAHIDARWPYFANELRNLRLILVANGVNPYGEKRNNWSTWPILLFIYNLTSMGVFRLQVFPRHLVFTSLLSCWPSSTCIEYVHQHFPSTSGLLWGI